MKKGNYWFFAGALATLASENTQPHSENRKKKTFWLSPAYKRHIFNRVRDYKMESQDWRNEQTNDNLYFTTQTYFYFLHWYHTNE